MIKVLALYISYVYYYYNIRRRLGEKRRRGEEHATTTTTRIYIIFCIIIRVYVEKNTFLQYIKYTILVYSNSILNKDTILFSLSRGGGGVINFFCLYFLASILCWAFIIISL